VAPITRKTTCLRATGPGTPVGENGADDVGLPPEPPDYSTGPGPSVAAGFASPLEAGPQGNRAAGGPTGSALQITTDGRGSVEVAKSCLRASRQAWPSLGGWTRRGKTGKVTCWNRSTQSCGASPTATRRSRGVRQVTDRARGSDRGQEAVLASATQTDISGSGRLGREQTGGASCMLAQPKYCAVSARFGSHQALPSTEKRGFNRSFPDAVPPRNDPGA